MITLVNGLVFNDGFHHYSHLDFQLSQTMRYQKHRNNHIVSLKQTIIPSNFEKK